MLYSKRMVASSVTVRLRGSYAEDRGSIPGRFDVFIYVVHIHTCMYVIRLKRV